jgi:para-nitrobenzyl esterase
MEARTTSGRVRGLEKDGVHRFLGVPYAAPPVRFAAPEPAPRWDGVRETDRPGPNAPQPQRGIPGFDLSPILGQGWRPGEDYLTVDVWTPGGDGLPVMVFLHGGAFLAGEPGAPVYDGTALARAGVVLVSVTYRLGAEGFLPLPGGATNIGLRDQLAALAWVRENAAAFGGDPGTVTVFGESAGAMSIGALLGSPLAAGLFDRAIVQSGGAEVVHSLPVLQEFAARFTAELGVEGSAAAVAERPIVDAIAALDAVSAPVRRGDLREPDGVDPGFGVGVLAPVTGDDVLPTAPLAAVGAGAGAEVDLLAGANDEEMNLYLVPTGALDAMGEDQAHEALATVHPDAAGLLALASGSPGERYASVVTELLFRGPARRLVEAHRGRGRSYEFGWRSPAFGGRLGACHGLELPFVFGTLDTATGPAALVGEDPPAELSREMLAAWTAFARTGDPGWSTDVARRFG